MSSRLYFAEKCFFFLVAGWAPLVTFAIDRVTGDFLSGQLISTIQSRNPKAPVQLDPQNRVARRIRELTNQDLNGGGVNIADDGTITVRPGQDLPPSLIPESTPVAPPRVVPAPPQLPR